MDEARCNTRSLSVFGFRRMCLKCDEPRFKAGPMSSSMAEGDVLFS